MQTGTFDHNNLLSIERWTSHGASDRGGLACLEQSVLSMLYYKLCIRGVPKAAVLCCRFLPIDCAVMIAEGISLVAQATCHKLYS